MRIVRLDDGADLTDRLPDAYPWPDSGRWVRAMMVTTLDGAAAGPDGLSKSITGDADGEVFDTARRFADAVLIGSGTLRAEKYGPLRARPDDVEARVAGGQSAAPRLVVVSGTLDLPWDLPVFAESDQRLLVLTGPDASKAAHARAVDHSEVRELGRLDAANILDTVADVVGPRINCEGGPTLLEAIVAADLLDEADITISPMFAGTAQSPRTNGLDQVARLELVQALRADDGFLMLRYLRPEASA